MKVLIDSGAGYRDYTRYVVDGTLSVEDSINVPTLVNFSLAPSDNTFVSPKRSSYVRVVSEVIPGKVLATGFVTNEPDREYLGKSATLTNFEHQQLAFHVNVTSDEWLLNSRAVPYIPAFVNQTMGQILAGIAEALAPGFFDVTSFMASGDIVPYFQYSPDKTWCDIAKEFGDSIRYHYKVIDKAIHFQPFGDVPLGIVYDEVNQQRRQYFPLELKTTAVTVPPVNDAIVIGDIEPQTNWENYFVGDGLTSQFRLRHTVFDASTAQLLQDDWSGDSFQTNLWKVQDFYNVMALDDGTGHPIGALNVTMGDPASGGLYLPLGQEYVLSQNGVEVGGGLVLQHGEFNFSNVCTGLVGGLYKSTDLTQVDPTNCLAAFQLTPSGTIIVTASGTAGIIIQPMFNGVAQGPQVVTQYNHYYQLETWIGADRWDRYRRIYKNLTGTVGYGGNNLSASGTITWVVRDYDINAFAITPLYGQQTILPVTTKFTVQDQDLPAFAIYAPINAQNLNLAVKYTAIYDPPQGSLYVAGLSGVSGLQLPIFPQNLGKEQHYAMGFGLALPTATVLANGDTQFLAFYNDTIPGVGSRIRYQSWEAGQSVARVQDPTAVALEAAISGDSGIRSAVMSNLNPKPRTSAECELACGAVILDREYPQFQGTYTIESIPNRFETLYAPSLYDYPSSGKVFYVNSPVRGMNGTSFFVHTARIQLEELRDEVMQISLDFGPDQYLEKMLINFTQRAESILTPQETAQPPNPIYLSQVGNYHLEVPDSAQVIDIENSVSAGNTVTLDLGPLNGATGIEIRRTDVGWGNSDANSLLGVFTDRIITLPRGLRDQTWYLRYKNGPAYSRFSKALRIVYPMIPSPPVLKQIIGAPGSIPINATTVVLDFNGDVRDIYGLEVRAPALSGVSSAYPFPNDPSDTIAYFSRQPLGSFPYSPNGNASAGYSPLGMTSPPTPFQIGDIVLLTCPDASFGGLHLVTDNTPGGISAFTPTSFSGSYHNATNTSATSDLGIFDGLNAEETWWGFPSASGGPYALVVSSNLDFPSLTPNTSNCYLEYSVDGGATWSGIYSVNAAAPWSFSRVDTVNLSVGQDLAAVRVRASSSTELIGSSAAEVIHRITNIGIVLQTSYNQFSWFDNGQQTPDINGQLLLGQNNLAGTAVLFARNGYTLVASGGITGGTATLVTSSPHGYSEGQQIINSCAWIPPVPPNQSVADGSVMCGQYNVSTVVDDSTFQFQLNNYFFGDVANSLMVGATAPMPLPTVFGGKGGVILRRPVFAPADLILDLTQPDIQLALEVLEALNAGNRISGLDAYFFNLTWDYSDPLHIPSFSVPAITGLTINTETVQLEWGIAQGVPRGHRIESFDVVTGITTGRFTIDHPNNPQPLRQAPIQYGDYTASRIFKVTPFDALGDGIPSFVSWYGASGGTQSLDTYTIGCTYNGPLPASGTMVRIPFNVPVQFGQNLVPSQAIVDTAPAGTFVIYLYRQASASDSLSLVGTCTFNTGQRVGVFSSLGSLTIDFATGNIIKAICQGTSDVSIADLGMTLSGVKN